MDHFHINASNWQRSDVGWIRMLSGSSNRMRAVSVVGWGSRNFISCKLIKERLEFIKKKSKSSRREKKSGVFIPQERRWLLLPHHSYCSCATSKHNLEKTNEIVHCRSIDHWLTHHRCPSMWTRNSSRANSLGHSRYHNQQRGQHDPTHRVHYLRKTAFITVQSSLISSSWTYRSQDRRRLDEKTSQVYESISWQFVNTYLQWHRIRSLCERHRSLENENVTIDTSTRNERMTHRRTQVLSSQWPDEELLRHLGWYSRSRGSLHLSWRCHDDRSYPLANIVHNHLPKQCHHVSWCIDKHGNLHHHHSHCYRNPTNNQWDLVMTIRDERESTSTCKRPTLFR